MAPDLFHEAAPGANAGDERSLMLAGGKQAAAAVTRFRDTFITLEDFRWLRDVGKVDAVRLPVGFWCLQEHARGTPFLPTSDYVDAAFQWAEACGLKVLLELHGAAGSQNGEHHSGDCGEVRWLEGNNRKKNLEVLRAWAKRWGRHPSLLGLGLGNEVGPPRQGVWDRWMGVMSSCSVDSSWGSTAQFYRDAIQQCRPHLKADTPIVIDTCWDMSRWENLLKALKGPIWLDYHHYQCMGNADPGHVEEHCEAAELRGVLPESIWPVMLGEFSLALKPEAEGYHDIAWQQPFFRNQTRFAARHCPCWFFWSYKMARQGWPHWSYRESVECGWINPSEDFGNLSMSMTMSEEESIRPDQAVTLLGVADPAAPRRDETTQK